MDLEEWEILHDDGSVEIHDDGGKKSFSTKYGGDPKIVFNMNYFICTSPNSKDIADRPDQMGSQFLQVPIELEKVKGFTDFPIATEKVKAPDVWETDHQHTVSQVFFNKTKENEFVDMKMDSPKSIGWGIAPQIDPGLFQFEDKREVAIERGEEMEENRRESDSKEKVKWERENGGLNVWKWSLSGIGAICSFGVAAATIFIIIIGNGNHQRKKKQQNQKFRFQIYADEKRIKQVVNHATELNEAISSAVRGRVPLTTTHFTYGVYYDHDHL